MMSLDEVNTPSKIKKVRRADKRVVPDTDPETHRRIALQRRNGKLECHRKIFAKLYRINDALKELESVMVDWRIAHKQEKLTADLEPELWWTKEIQKALRAYQFLAQYSMPMLMERYLLKNERG